MADEEGGDGTPEGGDGTPVGDTPEVHDTIHPGDLPPDHPGRPAAEDKLEEARKRDDEHYKHEGGFSP
jgi:hypothetical protein